MIVQELFLTDLAKEADVVLPALSFAEREGTFTSGDRRVQRFYPALPGQHGTQAKADWWVFNEVARRMGSAWSFAGPAAIFAELALRNPYYNGLSYDSISQSDAQWPPMGREDLYYGGTVYDNDGGQGLRYANAAESGRAVQLTPTQVATPSMGALSRPARKL